MENTIIIKKDGTGINSKDCYLYQLDVRMRQKRRKMGETRHSKTECFDPKLVAHTDEKEEFISDFKTIDDASNALLSLVKAIQDQDKIWDVREHNSNI
jgi:hypothetical protein